MSTSLWWPIVFAPPPSASAAAAATADLRDESVDALRPLPPESIRAPPRAKLSERTSFISLKMSDVFSFARVAPAWRGFSSPLPASLSCARLPFGDGGRELGAEPASPSACAAAPLSACLFPFTSRYAEPRSRIASQ